MNSGLIYLTQKRCINYFKKFRQKPLKGIATLLSIVYFSFVALNSGNMLSQVNLDNTYMFILMITGMNLYMFLPSLTSYLNQKGLIVRKADVHFIFSTPVPPKQFILYSLTASAIISHVFYLMTFFLGLSLYTGSVVTLSAFFIINFFISYALDSDVALFMYANESLSPSVKKFIKYFIFIAMFVISGLILYPLYQSGWDWNILIDVIQSTWFLCIPYVGWQTALMELMLIGPTTANIIGSVLYVVGTVIFTMYIYKMKCTGKYYEGADAYSETLERAYSAQKKGNVSFSSKKPKQKTTKDKVQGTYASTIFYNTIIEFKRKNTWLQLGKVLLYIGIIVLGYFMAEDLGSDFIIFYAVGVAILKSFMIMNSTNQYTAWQNNYSFYVLPDTMIHKIFYLTLFNNILTLVSSTIIFAILGIVIGSSILDIIMAILVYTLLTIMLDYISLVTQNLLMQKLGQIFGVWVYMFSIVLAGAISLIPCAILFAMNMNLLLCLIALAIPTLLISYLCIFLAGKLFTYQEAEE